MQKKRDLGEVEYSGINAFCWNWRGYRLSGLGTEEKNRHKIKYKRFPRVKVKGRRKYLNCRKKP